MFRQPNTSGAKHPRGTGGTRAFPFANGLLAVVLMTGWLAGCKSSPAQYISPRVTGRVFDHQTRQPIPGVQIQRLKPENRGLDQPHAGGEALQQTPSVWTQADGTFAVDSRKDLFSPSGWYAISLAFSHAGYTTLQTNYTIAHAIKSPKGEPVVDAGDILLRPLPR